MKRKTVFYTTPCCELIPYCMEADFLNSGKNIEGAGAGSLDPDDMDDMGNDW